MINGLFNQALVPFAYLFVKVLAPALLFGSRVAGLDDGVADGFDRHHHCRRHSGRAL